MIPNRANYEIKGAEVFYGDEESKREFLKCEKNIKNYFDEKFPLSCNFKYTNSNTKDENLCIKVASIFSKNSGQTTSFYIQKIGVEGKKALVEITPVIDNEALRSTVDKIKIYGIDHTTKQGQKVLIKMAKIAAAQDADTLSESIEAYKIDRTTEDGQQALIKIAKIAAAQDGGAVTDCIQNYGIDSTTEKGQQALIEIAKIAAAQNGEYTSEGIENYGIDNSTEKGRQALLKIAKIAAAQNGIKTLKYILNYGIDKNTEEGQRALVKIALQAAAENGTSISKYIRNYQIDHTSKEGQRALIKIAEKAAAQSGCGTSAEIQNYQIDHTTAEGQRALIKIAKKAAAQAGLGTSCYIQNYQIDKTSEEGRRGLAEIAEVAAAQSGWGTTAFLEHYQIDNTTEEGQEALVKIAKKVADKDGEYLAKVIQEYKIRTDTKKGRQAFCEIIEIIANRYARKVSENIQNYGIDGSTKEGQELLVQIAKIVAARDGSGISKKIQNFGIDGSTKEGQEALIEIAKIAATQNGEGASQHLGNYKIDTKTQVGQQALIEIANIAITHIGVSNFCRAFFCLYKYYEIADAVEVQKILRNLIAHNLHFLPELIQWYEELQTEKSERACAGEALVLGLKKYQENSGDYLNPTEALKKYTDYSNFVDPILSNAKLSDLAKARCAAWMLNVIHFAEFTAQDFKKDLLAANNAGVEDDNFVNNKIKESFSKLKKKEMNYYLDKFIDKTDKKKMLSVEEKLLMIKQLPIHTKNKIIKYFDDNVFKEFKIGRLINLIRDCHEGDDRDKFTHVFLSSCYFTENNEFKSFLEKNIGSKAVNHKIIPGMLISHILYNVSGEYTDNYLSLINKGKKAQQQKKADDLTNFLTDLICLDKNIAWISGVNKNLYTVLGDSILSGEQKLELLSSIGTKASAHKGKDKKAVVESQLQLAGAIVSLGYSHRIFTKFNAMVDLKGLFEEIFKESFENNDIPDIDTKYYRTFGRFKNPADIFTYLSSLKKLEEDKELALDSYNLFIKSVLEDTFKKERYDRSTNPHLAKVFDHSEAKFQEWKNGEAISEKDLMGSQKTEAPNETKDIISFIEIFNTKILVDNHLGSDWKINFPHLSQCLVNPDLISIQMKKIEAHLPTEKDEGKIKKLQIERGVLQLCENKNTSLATDITKILEELHLLTEGYELQNDIQAFLSKNFRPRTHSEFIIEDTDEPEALLRCGSDSFGSCQRLDGAPKLNKGLLGYLWNGQTRLIAVRDDTGKLMGRCLLRVLWDEKKQMPALHRERSYLNQQNVRVEKLLDAMANRRAAKLNLPLYGEDESPELKSLGGLSPWEYVDSAGGIKAEAVYTIEPRGLKK